MTARSVNRDNAIALGIKFYVGNIACKHCGTFEKYVSTSFCYKCAKERGLEKLNNAVLMTPYRTNEKKWSYLREWRKENPEKLNMQIERGKPNRQKYYNKNKEKIWRKGLLRRKYGITLDEYRILYETQGGVCKICKLPCSSGRLLGVDHCHKTYRIRGLLCKNCNIGLGLFKDNIKNLETAIDYLKGDSHEVSINF